MENNKQDRVAEVYKMQEKRDLPITKLTEEYTSEGLSHKIDIYIPNPEAFPGTRPGILFFFGGGFKIGSRVQFAPQAEELAKQGFIAFCADYRILSKHNSTPRDSIIDGAAAWTYVYSNASKWNLDKERVAISGGSAGGTISLLSGTVSGILPAALVLFNPGITPPGSASIMEGLDVVGSVPAPNTDVLKPGMPPMLILHGEEDAIIPASRIKEFADAAANIGIPCSLKLYEGMGHGFFNFNRDRAHYFMTLGQMMKFLKAVLG